MAGYSQSATEIRVWDLPLRLFHWLLVLAIAVALLSAEENSVLNQWHVMAGWIAAILLAFRLAWGFMGGEHSRFARFVRPAAIARHGRDLLKGRPEPTVGHNPLGSLSVLALLTLIAITVWTGVALEEDLHEVLGWTLLALVVVHVVAVIVMSRMTRENLVRAMITGKKPATLHPGVGNARPPSLLALVAAALVLAGATYAILSFDPLALTPRRAEAFEHRMEAAPDGHGREDGSDRRDADD
jgi:cytochrome b